MKQFTAVGMGEILWDVLPTGRKLGGAPANFAYHVNALGGTGIPFSRIGDDDLGREALDILREHGVATDQISVDTEHPTGTVDAAIDANGVATYTFPDDVAWDFLAFDEAERAIAMEADAICFGTLAQRSSVSRDAILDVLGDATKPLKIYDINLRQEFYTPERVRDSLIVADVLKINDEELALVAQMFSLPRGEREAMQALLEAHDLTLAVLTRGGEGSLILSADDCSDLPGQPTEVVDTIGAGDSFTAAMALAYLSGRSLDEVNQYAASVAAYVCTQAGAMPPVPGSLRLS
ncbi:carbohydrate kinase [Pseudodesulfovibrio sp. zrk46]|uniref:carbohydrate kinase family protein n=1 Tax=Pseudodesulfovibrio sp. zrk46 TaxID=2725288 RepID=UPI001449EEAF|nr:carbohydrate kinase [Pseudodesulfovibrio sp. zrk46]QJB56173.1 carbohydrate kinase [Pseudodesulfovibrio sp. zrk46]